MPATSENCVKSPLLEFNLPELKKKPGKSSIWELEKDWDVLYLGNLIDIPWGFETDGASIPVLLRPICGSPIQAPRLYAAIVHDYLYMTHAWPRDLADDLYRDMQIMLKISPVKAWLEWFFIRAAGWLHW